MAPCEVEAFDPDSRKWFKASPRVEPEHPPASLSNNKPDGTREIILFGCLPDDSKTIIWRSKAGIDVEVGKARMVASMPGACEVIKELTRGESFEMDIVTDRGAKRKIRFTHK
jgi:hypothetical protein